MSFTTLRFLIFFAVVFIGYYSMHKSRQYLWLLAAGYVFYAFASPAYLIFLLVVTAATYAGGLLLGKMNEGEETYLAEHKQTLSKEEKKAYRNAVTRRKKVVLLCAITVAIAPLLVLKYAEFIVNNLFAICGIMKGATLSSGLHFILPIGLSFYTFQSLGYCIDVYRGVCVHERGFFKYALFVSFFPQLLQGPIGSYTELSPQLLEGRDFDYNRVVHGAQRVLYGFFKKLVIANQTALVINSVFDSPADYHGLTIFIAAILYSIQIYADFSGYIDMAIGCSEMLGIRLSENFSSPYFSKNIAEFWRRWHITLGTWFKNYVFYSILRSQWIASIRGTVKHSKYLSGMLPNVMALLLVWFMIGIWHGADWSFVVYGLYHGGFIIVAVILLPFHEWMDKKFPWLEENRIYGAFRMLRTFVIVSLGYLIFRPSNLEVTSTLVRNMIETPALKETVEFIYRNFQQLLVVGVASLIIFVIDVYRMKREVNPVLPSLTSRFSGLNCFVRWTVYVMAILSVVFLGLYGSDSQNQFAYFRF
jgi:D-alanyl-lipoteichoic acid acyltransferase DltB (MBOAT superfamily)